LERVVEALDHLESVEAFLQIVRWQIVRRLELDEQPA